MEHHHSRFDLIRKVLRGGDGLVGRSDERCCVLLHPKIAGDGEGVQGILFMAGTQVRFAKMLPGETLQVLGFWRCCCNCRREKGDGFIKVIGAAIHFANLNDRGEASPWRQVWSAVAKFLADCEGFVQAIDTAKAFRQIAQAFGAIV